MGHTDDEERRIARETERELEAIAYNEFLIEMKASDHETLSDTASEWLDSEDHIGPDAEKPLSHEASGYRIGLMNKEQFSEEQSMNRLETVRDAVARIPGVFVADLFTDEGDILLQVFTRRPRLFAMFAGPLIHVAGN